MVPLGPWRMHIFHIGQTVFLEQSIAAPGGAYVVTKRLPECYGEFESELSATP